MNYIDIHKIEFAVAEGGTPPNPARIFNLNLNLYPHSEWKYDCNLEITYIHKYFFSLIGENAKSIMASLF